ncbi:hypothetical protein [Streptomyces iakyrus]|uniref:hypothetical protein n=1 Tax=Streptomyces iakyrus TaxID=68219 RepID=UPI0036FDA24A
MLAERLATAVALPDHPLPQIGTKGPQVDLRLRVGHQLVHPHAVGSLADEQTVSMVERWGKPPLTGRS